jgi:hypothetical protein
MPEMLAIRPCQKRGRKGGFSGGVNWFNVNQSNPSLKWFNSTQEVMSKLSTQLHMEVKLIELN